MNGPYGIPYEELAMQQKEAEERCRELEEAAKNLYDKVYPLIDGMSKDSWPHG